MKTAGLWPWKSASAKKCVTTYLPNEAAPKMDGDKTYYLYTSLRGPPKE